MELQGNGSKPHVSTALLCVEKKTVSETGNHHILNCLTLQAIKMDEEERKTMEYDAQVSLFVPY